MVYSNKCIASGLNVLGTKCWIAIFLIYDCVKVYERRTT